MVIPNQIPVDDTSLVRGAACARRSRNWWRNDHDDAHDDAPAAPFAVPLSLVRRPHEFAARPPSAKDDINLARRHAGAPAVTTRLETVASAGRRAGGREPARTQ
jgi:hypothetical protein